MTQALSPPRPKKKLQVRHLLWAVKATRKLLGKQRLLDRREWSSLRRLHARSNGLSSRLLTSMIRVAHPSAPVPPEISSRVLQLTLARTEIEEICREVSQSSFAVLPATLPAEKCQQIVEYATQQIASLQGATGNEPHKTVYSSTRPEAPIYNWFADRMGEQPCFRALVADPLLQTLASRYLGCEPVLYSALVWASPVFGGRNLSEAAQMYHYDFDGTKFLKFFVYLSDVESGNGPHKLIPGSHMNDKRSRTLRARDGRFTDAEIEELYDVQPQPITGKAGTVFAEDTFCWHKGEPPTEQDRWVLQLCYSSFLNGDTSAHSFRETIVAEDLLAGVDHRTAP